VGQEPRDRFMEMIYPIGGISMNGGNENTLPFRRKIKENYLFSDDSTSGR